MWKIRESNQVRKQIKKLGKSRPDILAAYVLLVADLKERGPVVPHWHHYGKLDKKRKRGPARHHCHLNKGTPRFVAIWEVEDKTVTILEMTYVGTHEGADY